MEAYQETKTCEWCDSAFEVRWYSQRDQRFCCHACAGFWLAHKRRATPIERFDSYTENRPSHGCWLWTGGKTSRGYGEFVVANKRHKAHRFSYEHFNGPIPDGLWVLHQCDTPACVNPAHLFLGTDADNMADKVKKGRHRSLRGSEASWSKLTEDDIRAIRNDQRSHPIIAKAYNMSVKSIWDIKNYRRWRHVE